MSTRPAFNMVFFSALADGHGERRRGDRIATVFARLHMLPSDTLSSNWRRCRKSDAFGGKSHFWWDHHLSSDIHRSWRPRLIGSDVMRLLQHIASMLLLI